MKRHPALRPLALLPLAALFACGGGGSPDAAAPADALSEQSARPDVVAPGADVVTPGMDSSPGADATPGTDAVVSPDTAPTPDVSVPPTDSEFLPDTVVPDGAPPTDGGVVTPGDPGTSDVRFTIDSTARRRAISPYIYGTNQPNWTAQGTRHATLMRQGGNRMTAYNWENNASNAGTDYMNQNDDYLCSGTGCTTPGETVRRAVAAAQAAGAASIVTVPIQGYVAADKSPGGDVNGTPNYLMARFRVSRARRGSAFSLTPDATDAYVNQDEFVNWLEHTFPTARTDAARTIFYMLDNEPDLWSSTHPRIHPTPVTYAEMVSRTIDYAGAIKSVAPSVLVFGPVNYGFNGYVSLQSAPDAGGRDFLNFFLDQLHAAESTAGHRLLDVLDVHFYSEATGGGVRITDSMGSTATQVARMQAPRSLWDPTYRENSWITNDYLNAPIQLIPRLLGQINAHYPGTRLSLSEYNHGGGADISGAVAQADTLGIFGREGVFAASLWELDNSPYLHAAFAMYRDYDNAGGAFGDTSVAGDTSDVANATVYASTDASGPSRVVLIAINRADHALTAGIAVTHATALATAHAWQLTSASATPAALAAPVFTARNALRLAMPSRSVTTLVLTP